MKETKKENAVAIATNEGEEFPRKITTIDRLKECSFGEMWLSFYYLYGIGVAQSAKDAIDTFEKLFSRDNGFYKGLRIPCADFLFSRNMIGFACGSQEEQKAIRKFLCAEDEDITVKRVLERSGFKYEFCAEENHKNDRESENLFKFDDDRIIDRAFRTWERKCENGSRGLKYHVLKYAYEKYRWGIKCAYSKHRYKEAFPILREFASVGDPVCQYLLSQMYGNGLGVEKSDVRAAKLLQKAATQKHALAMFDLGICFLYGMGVVQDTRKGLKLLKESIRRSTSLYTSSYFSIINHGDEYLTLAEIFSSNEVVPANCAKALQYYMAANEMSFCSIDVVRKFLKMLRDYSDENLDSMVVEDICLRILWDVAWMSWDHKNGLYSLEQGEMEFLLEKLRQYAKIERYQMNGEALTLAEWAKKSGIAEDELKARIEKGLPTAEVVTVNKSRKVGLRRRKINLIKDGKIGGGYLEMQLPFLCALFCLKTTDDIGERRKDAGREEGVVDDLLAGLLDL